MLERTFTFWRRWVGDSAQSATTATIESSADEDRRLWIRYPADLHAEVQLANDARPTGVSVQVCDISRGGASLLIPLDVQPGQMINLELPRAGGDGTYTVLACVVRSVCAAEGAWSVGCVFSRELTDDDLIGFGARRERPPPDDQRTWLRFDCNLQAQFQQIGSADAPAEAAQVLNLSASGVGLLVNRFVDAGALLNVDLSAKRGAVNRTILACVVHVTQNGAQWALGCNFIRELSDEDLRALLQTV